MPDSNASTLLAKALLNPARWLAILLVALTAGCSSLPLGDVVFGSSYAPTNVSVAAPRLPEQCRRVAVLPMASANDEATWERGRQDLEPVMRSELVKCGRFESVFISTSQLENWTGNRHWRASEALPAGLLARVHEATACDAILFVELSDYRPYPPLAIGWKARLVEWPSRRDLWAADEVFDSGRETVVNAARRYQLAQQRQSGALQESRSILASPRRFAQYTLHALLETLPAR